MKTNKYIILAIAVMAFFACKKQETIRYQGGELITFFREQFETDSTSYTFAFHAIPKQRDTINVKMRIQGSSQSRSRSIKVKPGVGTTAVLGVDFLLPEIQLPANTLTINYPVIVLNSEKLKNETLRIVVEVAASEDLQPGGTGREVAGSYAMNSYIIWFSNKAVKPAYWNSIEYYFGPFSVARLSFMIKTLGINDFSPAAIGDYGLFTYPVTLRNALAKQVLETGELLIDEFGEEVTF